MDTALSGGGNVRRGIFASVGIALLAATALTAHVDGRTVIAGLFTGVAVLGVLLGSRTLVAGRRSTPAVIALALLVAAVGWLVSDDIVRSLIAGLAVGLIMVAIIGTMRTPGAQRLSTHSGLDVDATPFAEALSEMRNEFLRSQRYERSCSAIGFVDSGSETSTIEERMRFVNTVYRTVRLTDLVTHDRGMLMVFLPETTSENACDLANRIQEASLGDAFDVAFVRSYPKDCLTLDELIRPTRSALIGGETRSSRPNDVRRSLEPQHLDTGRRDGAA